MRLDSRAAALAGGEIAGSAINLVDGQDQDHQHSTAHRDRLQGICPNHSFDATDRGIERFLADWEKLKAENPDIRI